MFSLAEFCCKNVTDNFIDYTYFGSLKTIKDSFCTYLGSLVVTINAHVSHPNRFKAVFPLAEFCWKNVTDNVSDYTCLGSLKTIKDSFFTYLGSLVVTIKCSRLSAE